MRKLDEVMMLLWVVALPIILALFILFIALWKYDLINLDLTSEQSMILTNILAITAGVFLFGWFIGGIIILTRKKPYPDYNEQIAHELEIIAKVIEESKDGEMEGK